MDVTFATKKLSKLFNSESKLVGDFGSRMAWLIEQRLSDLAAADNLEVMRSLPGRCHELTANLSGKLAVDLVHPRRLIFSPTNDPRPVTKDGALIWAKVTRIEIEGIVDYHKK